MYKDPRYLYPNTDAAKVQLIADLNAHVKKVRAELPKYFGTLPKAGLGDPPRAQEHRSGPADGLLQFAAAG